MSKEKMIETMARRVAKEFKNGDLVNLGIGMPTQVSNYIPAGIELILQSENGMLKMGPTPKEGEANPRITNAGGQPSSDLEGGMFSIPRLASASYAAGMSTSPFWARSRSTSRATSRIGLSPVNLFRAWAARWTW